jgi:2-polyprenyl-3-methyl-5-hydroxy-6-metoxy-1,4-benzoquinol methylase
VTLQTNYPGHDRQYRLRREAGQSGWDTADGIAATLTELAREFDSPHTPKSGDLLEMGCGAGDLSLFLASRGYNVTGVDISPFAIEWAREKTAEAGIQASFHVGDVRDLAAFADASFDLVLDGQCLHCIIGEEDRTAFLRSAYRVLRPGGVLHLRTMCGDPRTPGLQDGFDAETRCQIRGSVAVRYVGYPDVIAHEVEAAGFEIREQRILRTTGEDMLILDAVKGAPQ